MKLLALDTATEACSVALDVDGRRLHQFRLAGREHSRVLPSMVQAIMAQAGLSMTQLDALVCGIGPGSFAGVRIGVAYAKGLAAGLDLPVVGVSSLALLAQAAIRRTAVDCVLAAIDARMDQVYFGVYRAVNGRAQALMPDRVCDPQQVSTMDVPAAVAVGSGWGRYATVLRNALPALRLDCVDGAALPDALDALDLAASIDVGDRSLSAARLSPQYLRNRVALTRIEQAAARRGQR